MTDIQISPTQSAFIARAASKFCEAAQEAIRLRGRFTVALSGGSTPLPIYKTLASSQQADQLDWAKIHFFWGDERPVPKDHPDSNYGHAYQALLQPRKVPSGNIHRIKGELEPAAAAEIYENELRSFFKEDPPQLDLILLGMGGDGHTASLFPGTTILTETAAGADLVAAVFVPRLDTWRISFTPKVIKAGRQIVFLVSGTEKAGTLAQVLEGPFQPEKYPSQLFRDDATWLTDQQAASELEETF